MPTLKILRFSNILHTKLVRAAPKCYAYYEIYKIIRIAYEEKKELVVFCILPSLKELYIYIY